MDLFISIISGILLLLLFVAFFGIIIWQGLLFMNSMYKSVFGELFHIYWFSRKLESKYEKVISDNFIFYQKLNHKNKRIFRRRLQKFINLKKFIPKGNLEEVTDEMKALIGASAIQITFGHPTVYLSHFKTIIVYSESYQSQITGHYHKGEVNTSGVIVLSWDNFLVGYLDPNDGRNLGLHEMAHALKIEDRITNNEYDFLDRKDILRFIKYTRIEAHKIVNGESSFFRDYAATNDHEFFAVVIENFFERPFELKESHQELYYLTTRILRQDPIFLNSLSR